MTLEESADRVAEILRQLSAEHGRPNSFSCLDIERAGGPYHLVTGRLGTSYLDEIRARLGGPAWGVCSYSIGKFFV